ncbi:MAG: ClcB-like voltage-gated chloride channel protein [Deltaproteobacteria bacterium]|jgi:CIC family chloride channel protein|nr:ClcB-like voltage-gated chloride channel protein [Deltaproteobacteria bacterium]
MGYFLQKCILSITGRLSKDNSIFFLCATAGLIGYLGALLVLFFKESFSGIRYIFFHQSIGIIDLARALPWWGRLLLPAAGGAVAGIILDYALKRASRCSPDDYLEAIAIGDGRLSVRKTLLQSVASLCSISSGASIGREGPMVQLAAMAGSALGRIFRFSPENLRILIACGATAGLAVAYNAPIAGLVFIAEIALRKFSTQMLTPMIVAAATAVAVSRHHFGISPVYQIPEFSLAADWRIFTYIGLGILCGFIAPAFRWVLDVSRNSFRRLGHSRVLTMTLGGLGVGLISIWIPDVWGNGYGVVNSILHTNWPWEALLSILVFKIIATSLSYGSGAVGGVFTPTLFVGATIGALYSHAFSHNVFAQDPVFLSYVLVGMGAFLSSMTYAPLMSILMIYELTLSYQIVLPLMLACVISYFIAQKIRQDSIYEKKECPAPTAQEH